MTTELDGWYVLTDGVSQLSTPRFFSSEEEIEQAQEEANYKSGGNLWWVPCQVGSTDKDCTASPEAAQQSA